MKFPFRVLLATLFAAGGAFACADSPTTARLSPRGADISFAKIRATDSLMFLTDTSYSDTALVLQRIVPLDADLSASAVIGPHGGSMEIRSAGVKIDIPSGALSAPTLITMTAYAGSHVAYDFQPHGLTFALPVKIQQSIKGTQTDKDPTLLNGMHGSYYGQATLDSAWVDSSKLFAKVQQNQIGYFEARGSKIRFYINHFSGYMVSCGRGE